MEEKQRLRHPKQRQLDQLQIEEYTATNRHGPGDHTFTIPKVDPIVSEKPKH